MSAASPVGAVIPVGFGVVFDEQTKQLDDHTLFGGSPARVLRLSPAGVRALAELRAGEVLTPGGGSLARRLVDAGLAHPRPPMLSTVDATVIIPVKDRPESLERCLASLGDRYPVVVVDDGSDDPGAIADVCAKYSVNLILCDDNRGPARARNVGLTAVSSEFVAFLDSDCVASPDWLGQLAGHLLDPSVAAVAPRVFALPSSTAAGRYTSACGSLDLGPREARVAPLTTVSYVPTAALLVRRSALAGVAGFDDDLRVGEDVDLVWRLHDAGWRVRYDPSVAVAHADPDSWVGLFARRFRYGTSAGPLARRHPRSMAPLVLYPWPSLAVAGVILRRPSIALAGFAASVLATRRSVVRADLPPNGVVPAAFTASRQTWLGAGRYATQFASPVLVALLFNRRTRSSAAALLVGPALATWFGQRPDLDPVPFVAARVADEAAYGAGVLTGAVRARTTIPVRPKFAHSWSIRRNT